MEQELREIIARQREVIADLQRQLGMVPQIETEKKLRVWYGLTPTEAAILARLYARRGGIVNRWALFDRLYTDNLKDRDPKILDVFMSKLRRKMPKGWIVTEWSRGFYLTGEALKALDALLALPVNDEEQFAFNDEPPLIFQLLSDLKKAPKTFNALRPFKYEKLVTVQRCARTAQKEGYLRFNDRDQLVLTELGKEWLLTAKFKEVGQ